MKNPVYVRVSCIIICLTIFVIMPCLVFYFVGVKPNKDWNNGAIMTTCMITNYSITESGCFYPRRNEICYYGDIIVTYNDTNLTYTNNVNVINSKLTGDIVLIEITKVYPINSSITCFYQDKSPADVRLKLATSPSEATFYVVFAILGLVLTIAFIINEIHGCYKTATANNQQKYNINKELTLTV